MTIDEAIEKYKEITNPDTICLAHCDMFCDKCVQESEQLVEWLEELKAIKNGGISDDVCEYKIKDKVIYASCNNKQIASAFCWFNECGDYKYCPYCGKKIEVVEYKQ